MNLAVGTSTAAPAGAAATEAVEAALAQCRTPAFALVFSTLGYAPDEVAAAVSKAIGPVPWAGCSSPAVISDRRILESGVAVGVLDAPHLKVGLGVSGPIQDGAREAGRAAAAAAVASLPVPPPDRSRALILIFDTSTGAAPDVVRGAAEVAGAGVAWTGGGLGADASGTVGAQFANGAALAGRAVAVALDCGSRVGAGVHHGWRPWGPLSMVTRSSGTLTQELEYKSAFDIYRQVVAAASEGVTPETFPKFSMAHPLGIPQATGEYLIRDPLRVEPGGAIRCVAEVPDGAMVRVMHGDHEALIEAAGIAASMARDDLRGPCGGAFIFDCVSRFLVLGESFDRELAAFRVALGAQVPFVGCLTFGEIAAFGACVPQFHNKTAVVLALPR